MSEDITAQRSRQMRGGKRGAAPVSEDLDLGEYTLTYDANNNPITITKLITGQDGQQWQKIKILTWAGNNLTSLTETMVLLSPTGGSDLGSNLD